MMKKLFNHLANLSPKALVLALIGLAVPLAVAQVTPGNPGMGMTLAGGSFEATGTVDQAGRRKANIDRDDTGVMEITAVLVNGTLLAEGVNYTEDDGSNDISVCFFAGELNNGDAVIVRGTTTNNGSFDLGMTFADS